MKTGYVYHALVSLLFLGLSGCSILSSPPAPEVMSLPPTNKSTTAVVSFPTAYRAAFMVPVTYKSKDGSDHTQTVFCSEPPPDVGTNTASNVTANGQANVTPTQNIQGSVQGNSTQNTVELAGRSELILLTREFLFRSCELSIAYPNGAPEYVTNSYNKIVDLIDNLGLADYDDAEARYAAAQTQLINAETQNMQAAKDYAAITSDRETKAQAILGTFQTDSGELDSSAFMNFLASLKHPELKHVSVDLKAKGTLSNDVVDKYLTSQPLDQLNTLVMELPHKAAPVPAASGT